MKNVPFGHANQEDRKTNVQILLNGQVIFKWNCVTQNSSVCFLKWDVSQQQPTAVHHDSQCHPSPDLLHRRLAPPRSPHAAKHASGVGLIFLLLFRRCSRGRGGSICHLFKPWPPHHELLMDTTSELTRVYIFCQCLSLLFATPLTLPLC